MEIRKAVWRGVEGESWNKSKERPIPNPQGSEFRMGWPLLRDFKGRADTGGSTFVRYAEEMAATKQQTG